jgi:hypothetical protein
MNDDPNEVSASLPMLSPEIDRLSALFDDKRLTEALEFVRTDQQQFSPRDLGQALLSRLLDALRGQDAETLGRALAMPQASREIGAEQLFAIARAKARALGAELEADLIGTEGTILDPVRPSLARASLAAACAVRGFQPEVVYDGALSSPLDIPGVLYGPALVIEVLFAYLDRGGLGPSVGSSDFGHPAAPATTSASANVNVAARALA